MRSLLSLAIFVTAAACSDDPATPSPAAPLPAEPARREPAPRAARPDVTVPAPARSPLLRVGDLGGWIPSHDDCAAATRYARAIAEDRCGTFTELTRVADRVRAIRAGLRLADDRAARLLAECCEREWLDLWEQRRVSELLVAAAFDPAQVGGDGEPANLDGVSEFGGREDLAAALRALRGVHGDRAGELANFGTLHKLLGHGHVPALIELTKADDASVRRFAYEMVGVAMLHSDRHRAEIAALIPPDATEIRIPADAAEPAISAETLAAWRARANPATVPLPARDEIERALSGSDVESRYGMLERLGDLCSAPGPWASARPEPWSAGLDRALLATDAAWDALVLAALAIPGCRTREVAEAAVARMPEACPIAWDDRMDATVRERFAFLETAAPASLLAKLRRWATADPPSDVAARFLLELRDASSASAIVAACERLRNRNWASVPWDYLGQLHHADVRAFLVRHVEGADGSYPPSVTMALEAIAEQDAFPAGVASWPWPGARADKDRLARLVLDGKPVEAFVGALANSPDEIVRGEGRVLDPRVRAHVESIRDRRELGRWFAATVELARALDPLARMELPTGLHEGRYRWIDDLADATDVLGPPGEQILGDWLPHLESNCCSATTVGADVLEGWFGWDPNDVDDNRWTPASAFQAWYDRHEGRFEFSRIADRWVPETR